MSIFCLKAEIGYLNPYTYTACTKDSMSASMTFVQVATTINRTKAKEITQIEGHDRAAHRLRIDTRVKGSYSILSG